MPIRVLQVFTILNRGGAETMIMNYYRQIDRSKMQFDFLVHRQEKGVFEDEIEALGGKIYRAPAINPFFPKKYYKFLNTFFDKSYSYKIIHSHLNTFSYFPLLVANKHEIPVRIAHSHIALEPLSFNYFKSNVGNLKTIFKNITKHYLKNRILIHSSHKFSCGKVAGEWLFGKNSDFNLLNNAINASKFKYSESIKLKTKKDLDLNGKFVIGHIGRFNHQKNHVFLLNIFKSILVFKPNAILLLVGDGELKSSIEALSLKLNICKNILFLGVREDVSNLLQAMDVFLFPSFYEGFPVTLIEAQAAGLRIFASETITKDVAFSNDVHFLSLQQTPKEWAHHIYNNETYERKNNVQLIKDNGYDIISNAKLLENFYLEKQTYER